MAEEKIPQKKECGLSRREFLIDAGLITGGVFLGASALSLAGCGGETVTTTVTAPGTTATVTAPGTTATVTATGPTTTVTTTKTGEPGVAAIPGVVTLNVNGRDYLVKVEPEWSLAYVLREKLGLTGTKIGCDRGECGACTVVVDGRDVYSCLVLAIEAEGKSILTVEGLSDGITLSPLQQAFYDNEAHQCGYCTPGFLMSAKALLDEKPNPTLEEIKEALSGHICSCGNTYRYVKTLEGGI